MKARTFYLAIGFLCVACSPPAEEPVGPAPLPEQPAFEGKTDEKLVGNWKSAAGESSMSLRADGTSTFQTKVGTPGGAQDVKSEGKWLTSDSKLLLQDTSGPQTKVIAYSFKLMSPKKLELSTTFPAMKTVYNKQ